MPEIDPKFKGHIYVIIARSYDGVQVEEFMTQEEAEKFCVEFLRRYRDEGGEVLHAYYALRRYLKTVTVAEVIRLMEEEESGD